jgi:hypothetical protein
MERLTAGERRLNRRVWLIGATAALLLVGAVALVAYRLAEGVGLPAHPSDEVVVTLRRVPADVRFLALASDGPGGLEAMDWYVSTVSTFPMHPRECSASWHFAQDPRDVERRVRWAAGGRVGIVQMREGRRWEVAWFGPARARPAGGRWEADLAAPDRAEPLTGQQVRDLGLDAIGHNDP